MDTYMILKDYGIQHFSLKELVRPEIYSAYHESRIVHWLDFRVLRAWDWIREERGNTIYVNTWGINTPDWYPEIKDRGLRWHGLSKTGSQTSQHFFGRAIDGDEVGVDNILLYEWILGNSDKILEFGVTTIEDIEYTDTWVHLDCRNWGDDEFHVVSP